VRRLYIPLLCLIGQMTLGVLVPDEAAADAIVPGMGYQTVDLGGSAVGVYTYRPQGCTPTSLLLLFHGASRNAIGYRAAGQTVADRWCMIVLAPFCDADRFPDWRYPLGGIVQDRKIRPKGEWTGNLVLQLVDWTSSSSTATALRCGRVFRGRAIRQPLCRV
jgi:poly(3-hydroxybutyrate) depolymerase